MFAGSCVKAGRWHSPNMMAPRLLSPKFHVQRNSSHDAMHPHYPASNCEKRGTKLGMHFYWNQPLHFQRAQGCWKDNTWHLTLER